MAPTPAILPKDSYARAQVRSLALLLVADTHPFITPRMRKAFGMVAAVDDAAWKTLQTHFLTKSLQSFEKRLAKPGTGRFCHGDTPGLADICLASIVVVVRILGLAVPGISTVDQIIAECEPLPALIQADPMKQVGAPG